MKTSLLALCVICPMILFSQTRLAVWTFDGLAASPNTPSSVQPTANGDSQSLTAGLYADGTNGSSVWKTSSSGNELTSQAGTTVNDPRIPAIAGNALTLANSSANGKSIVVKFSMTGLRDPSLSFTIRSTATGFSTHAWSWSTDGNTFTAFSSYTTNQTSTYYLQTLNLASVNELDGAPLVYLRLTVSGATASNGNNRLDNLILSAIIPVPAAFASDYPALKAVTKNSLNAVASLTSVGKVYFVLLSSGAVAPSSSQIKNQQDASGYPVLRAGQIACISAYTEYQFDLDQLEPETTYDLYLVAENDDGLQPNPAKLEITTFPDGDHSPPFFNAGYPNAKAFGAAVIIKINLNEPGNAFVVAVKAGAQSPSAVQIMEGQNGGSDATANSHISIWTSDTEYLTVFSRLQPSSEYDFYIVLQDTASNVSPISKLTVTAPTADQGGDGKLTVATYNLDFFASDVRDEQGGEYGPVKDTLQAVNVAAVLKAVGADVIAVEEISNEDALNSLVAGLGGYNLIISDHWSHSWEAGDPHFPPQKTGLIYNRDVAHLVDYEVMFSDLYDQIQKGASVLPNYPGGDPTAFWSSGRLPLTARFDVAINGISQRIRFIVIHSKSGSSPDDYSRRVYDTEHLFNHLTKNYKDEKIILLGDFNDDVDQSIVPASISPYHDFVDDTSNYRVLTYTLSRSGASTFPALNSFIDHFIVSSEFSGAYVGNSLKIFRPDEFVGNYLETTSDHFPVVARFTIKHDQTITFSDLQVKTYGDGPMVLTASSSSSKKVVYSVTDPTVAFLNDSLLTILKAGTTEIVATQGGDSVYYPAAAVTRVFYVRKAGQTINVRPLPEKTLGDPPFDLDVSVTSALPIVLTTESSNISLSGQRVTILGPGRASVLVRQSGNENYLPVSLTLEFCIAPPAPVITADFSKSIVLSSSSDSGNQWFLNGKEIPGATAATFTPVVMGNYKASVTIATCHSAFSNEIPFQITETASSSEDFPFVVFPNPAREYVVIRCADKNPEVNVFEMGGKRCDVEMSVDDKAVTLEVSGLAPAMYILRINDGKAVRSLIFQKH